jgi:antitoxin (DNA-binding transcriptional repressor) of toxin-antitoxin stability system
MKRGEIRTVAGSKDYAGKPRLPQFTVIIEDMEPPVVHISEAELVRDIRSVLQRVETGAEVIIERDAQPVAVLRAAAPVRRTISECIALAKAHEEESGESPILDPDFAEDVDEIIRSRKPWNPPAWD